MRVVPSDHFEQVVDWRRSVRQSGQHRQSLKIIVDVWSGSSAIAWWCQSAGYYYTVCSSGGHSPVCAHFEWTKAGPWERREKLNSDVNLQKLQRRNQNSTQKLNGNVQVLAVNCHPIGPPVLFFFIPKVTWQSDNTFLGDQKLLWTENTPWKG